ncbi:Methyltransferase domain-containing protein [Sporobacter termitidis DSM 10068]|uniref:Methyltransferase domain-containing protein n=1 Tax=Sporobacter termitidis DSM 10068 TaxID=1123282 RepID=A0A1M5Y415_9FIRM|nr:class I SAM-dependent methyltransferase [Sporobacter termitidis]SHI06820.1 Methyltransferase domain-containing protein [Sporobacter termitidis DSM 10068]
MDEIYTDINARTIDAWVDRGWEWGRPVSREIFEKARRGDWSVVLTPNKPVPKEWFCAFEGAEILGLASGGGQQMPIFTALGARCTVLDYSEKQLQSEKGVAARESYEITTVRADMTKPLPFPDGRFDLIFHPVSNCYIEDVVPVWRECCRVLKKGGILLSGFDNGFNYVFDDEETGLAHRLPFNPLKDQALYDASVKNGWGIQFSHTIEEQLGGQLRAGFILTDIYQDTNGSGRLADYNVPTFYATRAVKA